jgi:hypothetical protein
VPCQDLRPRRRTSGEVESQPTAADELLCRRKKMLTRPSRPHRPGVPPSRFFNSKNRIHVP